MSTARIVRIFAALALLAAVGCVNRRFIIESNVPNAQVFIDNKPIGAAPAHTAFEYYGHYTIKLVHPEYETLEKRIQVSAPWYAYPPFDFAAEVLWPFPIRDTRRYYFEMFKASPTRTDDILNAADALRQRGMAIPAPERPAAPRPQPAPQPQPQPNPLVPSVVPSVQP